MTRQRAAAVAHDPKLRQRLLIVAEEYERLAKRAHERAGGASLSLVQTVGRNSNRPNRDSE
jgi:hypothetical protein